MDSKNAVNDSATSEKQDDDDMAAPVAKKPRSDAPSDDDTENSNAQSEDDGMTFDISDLDEAQLRAFLEQISAAHNIPLQYLLEQVNPLLDDDDDEELEYPFGHLPETLLDVANFIRSDKCKKVLVLAGAGMSVSSGIPDYRSAGGFYSTLPVEQVTASPEQQEKIRADPTAALEQGLFLENPFPCLELKRDFILGTHQRRWKATIAHRFVELLHKKGKLARLYTQNIDGLEDQCVELPVEKVVNVHGSMDRAECASCGASSNFDDFCSAIQTRIKDLKGEDPLAPKESLPIRCQVCGQAALKPAIVLFRSSLPQLFFEKVPDDVEDVDLLIVLGTSLRVAPVNSIVYRVPKTALRVVINREPVGQHLGIRSPGCERPIRRDYFAEGDCDGTVLELVDKLGWLDELKQHADTMPKSCSELLSKKLACTSQDESK